MPPNTGGSGGLGIELRDGRCAWCGAAHADSNLRRLPCLGRPREFRRHPGRTGRCDGEAPRPDFQARDIPARGPPMWFVTRISLLPGFEGLALKGYLTIPSAASLCELRGFTTVGVADVW